MENRVRAAVELERLDPEARAEREVERRRGLDPAAVDAQVGIAVVDEEVAAHGLGKAGRGEVVLHVGEAQPRFDARGACARRKQRRLAHAETLARLEHRGGAEDLGIGEIEERVVADLVAHRVVKGDCAFALVIAIDMFLGKSNHEGMHAIDVPPGREIRRHWSSFIRRRAPANSALFWSARPSTTEKWFLPGMAMSPVKAARQRSPSSVFWRWNSLDSAPPTQLMTGARVAGAMKAGESLRALAGSSFRSAFSQSTSINGRRS